MRLGIPKLDELLGEIEPGSIILISTVGDVGMDLVIQTLKGNGAGKAILVTPRLEKQLKNVPGLENSVYFALGRDFGPQELFKVTHLMKELPYQELIGVLFLQPLLVFHPPITVYRFLSELADIAISRNFVLMTIIDKRLLDERTLAMFEELSTYVIDITEVVEGFRITRGIRIKKSPGSITGFYRLDIEAGSINIGEPLE